MNVFPPVNALSNSSGEETLELGAHRPRRGTVAGPKGKAKTAPKAKTSPKAKPKTTPKAKAKQNASPRPEVTPETKKPATTTEMKKPAAFKRPASCLSSEGGAIQVFFYWLSPLLQMLFLSSSILKVDRQAEVYQRFIATRRPTSMG